jgi:hypothetical protein
VRAVMDSEQKSGATPPAVTDADADAEQKSSDEDKARKCKARMWRMQRRMRGRRGRKDRRGGPNVGHAGQRLAWPPVRIEIRAGVPATSL